MGGKILFILSADFSLRKFQSVIKIMLSLGTKFFEGRNIFHGLFLQRTFAHILRVPANPYVLIRKLRALERFFENAPLQVQEGRGRSIIYKYSSDECLYAVRFQ